MLFRFSEVYKSYGAQDVLRGVSLQINPGEHVGLVGRNGAGKTTLFRLIGGEETPDSGDVVRARGLKLGLLEQHVDFEPGMTVHESALAAFGRLQQIEHEMHELEHRMAEATDDLDAVLERYSDLQHEFEREGGFEYAARAEAILLGLGFEREMWQLETEKLSGGQKNRLGMARLLLAEPDVLLLDEPTNHLDVAGVEWLEEYLSSYGSAYVIISHDRYFLDRSCRRIIEVENGKAVSYNGNYSAFLVEREERREAQRRAYENQQHLIAKTEEFIRRNLAGQKTKQAKSRRTMLQKMDRVEAVRADASQGNFQLKGVERTGNQTLIVKELAVGYPDKVLATDITFTLTRGEALGVIGPNGSGKTTFIKTLLGKLPSLAGEARWGTKVQIGYYAQQLDDLDDRNEIIMELRRVAPSTVTAGELRGFLAKFLFVGDDVYKHVRDLSGGEKGRLALAKLIYSRVNVLVLDEPTNHLDIPSRESLEEALDAYEGTIITISHDRYFLDRVATQILALDGQSAAEHYDGDYTEYHDWKALTRAEAAASARAAQERQQSAPVVAKTSSGQEDKAHASRKAKSSEGKGGKKKSSAQATRTPQLIESEIAEVEKRLATLSEELSRPDVARDPTRAKTLNAEYQQTDARLRSLYEEWERIAAEAANA
ncbi:MAG TPA: ABC-F family ATP-binding cassette domain-containing protein [Pyrinomonadaceae bacterium]|jgi:ATP-binding cassette subfamily F protein 3|nr:ABC-F family ATP-binding cassette domain-containing protein [Pyrinomonadaceae bacterium]